MKTTILKYLYIKKESNFFAVLAVLGMLCACASGGQRDTAKSGIADLDTAIKQASREITDSLPSGTKVALLNFSSESDVFSDYVIEEMSIALVKGKKLVVVDRKEIDLIRGEMNFQMSGEVSDESAQKIGMMLGAQSIVSGSLVNMGENYRFRTKAINVNSAAIQTSSSISVSDDPQIKYLLGQGKRGSTPQLAPQATSPTAVAQGGTQAVPAQATASAQAYKIGDTGPAGGLIFYDKGNNNGGWRYLEAAPEAAEFRAVWSESYFNVGDDDYKTRIDIGFGKRNTQFIVEKFRQTTGNWNTAAQKAQDLSFNGFEDWFLPSQTELDQIFGNLKRKNLGDFKDERYWTSTEAGYYNAYCQNFKDGKMDNNEKTGNRFYVRPIRQIAGPAGTARSSADDPAGTGGTKERGLSAKTKGTLWSVLGALLVGGILAFVIWGPAPAMATS